MLKNLKNVLLITLLLITLSSLFSNSVFGKPAPPDLITKFYYGDVDKDGKVTSEDARLIMRYSVGLEKFTAEQVAIADINKDGKVTTEDARLALRTSVGSEPLIVYSDSTIYTKGLKKGYGLRFKGSSWKVYNSKENAKNKNANGVKRYLKYNELMLIKEIDGNVIKIKNGEYIYYGETAKKYFEVSVG